ncbi:hypothetical protein DL768_004643 [Monosporascus sp. mg162]|nr:hypothetical protein DL768_004643 [Monosporascus sp. mg162]
MAPVSTSIAVMGHTTDGHTTDGRTKVGHASRNCKFGPVAPHGEKWHSRVLLIVGPEAEATRERLDKCFVNNFVYNMDEIIDHGVVNGLGFANNFPITNNPPVNNNPPFNNAQAYRNRPSEAGRFTSSTSYATSCIVPLSLNHVRDIKGHCLLLMKVSRTEQIFDVDDDADRLDEVLAPGYDAAAVRYVTIDNEEQGATSVWGTKSVDERRPWVEYMEVTGRRPYYLSPEIIHCLYFTHAILKHRLLLSAALFALRHCRKSVRRDNARNSHGFYEMA